MSQDHSRTEVFRSLLDRDSALTHVTITKEEIVAAWGQDFFYECDEEARKLRQQCWEHEKSINPNTIPIDMEPSVELVLAVGIRKIIKVTMLNRGDFPQTIGD